MGRPANDFQTPLFRIAKKWGLSPLCAWLGWTCGACEFCAGGRENLCAKARFTGYHLDGGFAEYALADERFCLALPQGYGDAEAAPLLCAGLIGYRSYVMTGEAKRIGLYGFGAAAHILAQVARAQGREIYAFTRPGDTGAQAFARRLGAVWAGGSDEAPPAPLDAAFLALAAKTPIRTEVKNYALERANEALGDLRSGKIEGAAVLVP